MSCIVCLVGAPASGKTTLARRLVRRLPALHIHFDDRLPPGGEGWREGRKAVAAEVEAIVVARSGEDLALILDDNMYYRSMRQEYLRMARRHRVAFCQLYLDTPLEVALERNAARAAPVPPDVLLRTAAALEPPRLPWEARSLALPPDYSLQRVVAFLREEALRPAEDPPAPEAPRPRAALSALHAADLALRKATSQLMAGRRADPARLRTARVTLMARVKCGDLPLPPPLEGLPHRDTVALYLPILAPALEHLAFQ